MANYWNQNVPIGYICHMSDGSELMHSHKYIQKYKDKKGNWVYVYDEDRGDKNQTGTLTTTDVSTGKTTTVGYTYNKNIDDRNEKEYKTTTKIANAVKPVTDKVSEVTGLSARKKATDQIDKTNKYLQIAEYVSTMLPFVSKNDQTQATRDIENASNQASRSYRVAMVYSKKYLNTPLGKIEGSIISAKSWLEKKLKKSK